MVDDRRWRAARFRTREDRTEFITHVKGLKTKGIKVERLEETSIRFRAPAEVEVGIAGMIEAHGGKVVPVLEPV